MQFIKKFKMFNNEKDEIKSLLKNLLIDSIKKFNKLVSTWNDYFLRKESDKKYTLSLPIKVSNYNEFAKFLKNDIGNKVVKINQSKDSIFEIKI